MQAVFAGTLERAPRALAQSLDYDERIDAIGLANEIALAMTTL
jgi:hypothetical protein